nr:hypothetical protein [Prevotella sp.]
MIDLLRKAYDGGANGLRTITCVMLFGVFLGGANSHVKASDSKTLSAHQKTTKNATTLSTSTQSNKAQLDVSKLVGADPGVLATKDNNCRLNPTASEYISKTFLLLNVGTEKFFNIGGAYGRHASLSNTGMYLWIWDTFKTEGTYNIRTRLNYVIGSETVTENKNNADSYVQYIDNDSNMPGIYPDCQPADANRNFGWKFEQAEEYSETNKVYKISTYEDKDGNRRYLTATPEDTDGNLCKAEALSNSENQVWKLVTLQEYYDLFKNSPSDPNSPIDITFLLGNPGFDYNKSNAPFWASSGKAHDFRLGVEDYYKKTTEAYYKDNVGNEISFNDNLYQNGKYFCADIKNQHKYKVSQSINVTQPGWYIIRCNGFSNTNFANLFITDVLSFYGFTTDEKYKMTVPLTQLSTNGPKDLLEAGKRFYNGEYENEVRIYISQEDIDYLEEYKLQEAIYFGIELEGDDNPNPQNEWTAFDNFRLLYAGESEGAPKLVLDEDNPDLKYLTETIEEYKNCNLHLKRSFELNKWNTLILPVDLTYGQMKEAFGNEVKLAELYKLTPNSVRFKTVECNSDNDVMLEAYTPYIIKPTKAAGQNSAYTTPRLKKAANQYWLGENESKSYTNEDVERYTGGKVSISESHYDIPGVTLNRALLKTKLDNHWVSTTTPSTTTTDADNKMVCKGTMAKTFYTKGNKGYFYKDGDEERDDLKGDYFMNKGIMYKVPNTKQYGLKAFRCWFELTKTTDQGINNTSQSKDVKLFINEIEDETTGIDDIITDPAFSHAAYQNDGVYNLQGQLVRQGTSLEGLPQGIYIVKGKKVKK